MDANRKDSRSPRTGALAIGAIGVVFGDIGTSPLYTMKEVFGGHHPIEPTHGNILGILSLVFWSLIVVVTLKYVIFLMRADNNGEGGIMAMLALVQRVVGTSGRAAWLLGTLGLFGAALFYGDAMITPAISVMSAVEGLRVAEPALGRLVVPISLAVLIALFAFQRRGTSAVGAWFGPVMTLWFLVLAGLGLWNLMSAPVVLHGVYPGHAMEFFVHHRSYGFLVLGAVVLAVTGAEALYADMGHFGRRPIRYAWLTLVLPALLLNYFGQGALLYHHPEAALNPFYLQAPQWALPGLIGLATLAALIASQAVITGAFSVTRQAIQLGYLPRMQVRYTSARRMGQVYMPAVNSGLLLGIVGLVIGFGSSSDLAAAYGLAVTGTMVIDTILGFVVVIGLWRWNRYIAISGLLVFLSFDLAYLSATATKLFDGGWFPLVIGVAMFALFSTWKRGRWLLMRHFANEGLDQDKFLAHLASQEIQRVPGTAVFLTARPDAVPHALLHNLAHNKVLHQRVAFVTVVTADRPFVRSSDRIELIDLGGGFLRIAIHYGFMNHPSIPKALKQCARFGHPFEIMETSFFLSRETIIPSKFPGMARWREHLFVDMARNAESAMTFFEIPANRVIELGSQVEI